jgi:Fic family protein
VRIVTRIELPEIQFDSELVRVSFELERLRGQIGRGTTPASIFVELHALFQLLTSIASARIEGNRTTINDAVRGLQSSRPRGDGSPDQFREISNIQEAMAFLDELDETIPLTHVLVRSLHESTVRGLEREGDPNPGEYRRVNVGITHADHTPPSHVLLMPEMDDFLDFANREVPAHQQLVQAAIAHHRFLWLHPFQNGNGRVSRLISYFMLRRHGFVSPVGLRAVNPTAVFGSDRLGYYDALAGADDLSDAGVREWCTFFVSGMKVDLQRLERLQHFDFVTDELIGPSLDRMKSVGDLTQPEASVMKRAVARGEIKAGDVADILPGSPSQRSVSLRRLIDRRLLIPTREGSRYYRPSFGPNDLTVHIVRRLDAIGMLPSILKD